MNPAWLSNRFRFRFPNSSDFLFITLTLLSWAATATGFGHLVQSRSVEPSHWMALFGVMIASGVVQVGLIVFFNDAYRAQAFIKKIMFAVITALFFIISATLSTAFYNSFLGVHKNLTSSALGDEFQRLSAHANALKAELESLEGAIEAFLGLVRGYGESERSSNEFGAIEGPRSKYWQQIRIDAENHKILVARIYRRIDEDLQVVDVNNTESAHQKMQVLALEMNGLVDKPLLKDIRAYYTLFSSSPFKDMPTLDKDSGQISPINTAIRGGPTGSGRWLEIKGQSEQVITAVQRLTSADAMELNPIHYLGNHGIYLRSMDILTAIIAGNFKRLTQSEWVSLSLGAAVDLILLVLLWSRIKTAGSGSLADNIEYLKSYQAQSLKILQTLSYKSGFTSFSIAIEELKRYGTGLLRSNFFGFYYFLPAKPSSEAVKLQRLTHHLEALDYVVERPFSQQMLKILCPHELFDSENGHRLLHIRPRQWKIIRNAVSIEVPLSKREGSELTLGVFIKEIYARRESKINNDVKAVTSFTHRYDELSNIPLFLFDIDHENQVVEEFSQNMADKQRLRSIIRYARELNMAPSESVEANQLIVSLKQR